MGRKSNFFGWVIFLVLVSGCAFFRHENSRATSVSVAATTVDKKHAVKLAKDFAAQQNLGDEFLIAKPAKITKELPISKNPEWVWKIYFPAKNESRLKFYMRTYLMIEVNASDGTIKEWGRR